MQEAFLDVVVLKCVHTFKKKIIYLVERETETQAEEEAGTMQGARCGT